MAILASFIYCFQIVLYFKILHAYIFYITKNYLYFFLFYTIGLWGLVQVTLKIFILYNAPNNDVLLVSTVIVVLVCAMLSNSFMLVGVVTLRYQCGVSNGVAQLPQT